MRATRISTPITIDGVIDEEAWEQAEPVDEFIQSKPQAGYPATEKTVVRVVYDDRKLYISAVCYDSEPQKAVVTTLEQDFDSPNSDNFGVTLDTFHDKRNAYLFQVNPRGALKDAQVFDDSRYEDTAWEGVTEQKVRMYDDRWVVELAIPFTTLRFDPSIHRSRLGRELSPPRPAQERGHALGAAGSPRLRASHVEGGHDARARGMQKGPKPADQAFRAGVEHDGIAAAGGHERAAKGDAGVDLKYGVTPSMTLDLTYRTDFSQIEVDQEQVNLTRFSLFFPEKRDFFMENAGIFQFGDLNERALRTAARAAGLCAVSLANDRVDRCRRTHSDRGRRPDDRHGRQV